MNKQRKAVYDMRRMVLEGKEARDYVLNLSKEVLEWYLDSYVSLSEDPEKWNLAGLHLALKETYGLDVPADKLATMGRQEMLDTFTARIREKYEEKERQVGAEAMLFHERMIMLQIVDSQWKDHLYAVDHLKEGIGLRGYGQRDPLVEYKKESYNMFTALMDRIDEEILRWVFLSQPVQLGPEAADGEPAESPAVRTPRADGGGRGGRASGVGPAAAPLPRPQRQPELALTGVLTPPRKLTFNNPGELLSGSRSALGAAQPQAPREAQGGTDEVQTVRRDQPKVGRNDPCPCGSGKKYKKCHGA
jgi:preprotein translocase subunit SecA